MLGGSKAIEQRDLKAATQIIEGAAASVTPPLCTFGKGLNEEPGSLSVGRISSFQVLDPAKLPKPLDHPTRLVSLGRRLNGCGGVWEASPCRRYKYCLFARQAA